MVDPTTVNDRDPEQGTLKIGFDPEDVMNWRAHLMKEGFVVLKGVLPKKDVDKSISLVFDWLESLNENIKRNDVSTWSNKNRFPGCRRGLLTGKGGA